MSVSASYSKNRQPEEEETTAPTPTATTNFIFILERGQKLFFFNKESPKGNSGCVQYYRRS
jgi:hypothetical protein